MKTLMILVFVLIIPFAAIAQNWTPDQQEVIDQAKRNWETWEKTMIQKDISIWKKECQPTDDFCGWWIMDGGLLWSIESSDRTFDKWSKGINDFYWENLQPVSVKVYDDVAVIYFYVIYNTQLVGEKWSRVEEKRLEVYKKVNGKWRWADAMVAQTKLDEVL